MIIFSNGLITLDYDPATDILAVALPDIRNFGTTEVERSLQLVSETITNYDIKKLLLDSSKAVVEVEDGVYKNIILRFSAALMKTRLKFLARIGSDRETQEKRARQVADEAIQTTAIPVVFRNFANREEALAWLLAQ